MAVTVIGRGWAGDGGPCSGIGGAVANTHGGNRWFEEELMAVAGLPVLCVGDDVGWPSDGGGSVVLVGPREWL